MPRAASSKRPGPKQKTPAKIPLGEHNADMVRLETEAKLITHAIRMAAYNTETTLARALSGNYARADDEAYALIREALHASRDIIPDGQILLVRLDPLSAPRHTRALAALCGTLNETAASYPATSYTLHCEIKEPTTARSPMSGVLKLVQAPHLQRRAFGEGSAGRLQRRAGGGLITSRIDQQGLERVQTRAPLSLSGDECIPYGDFRRLRRC